MIEIIPNFLLCDPIFTVIIIPFIIGIIASFFVVIFYDFIIFRRFYLNLCKEIEENYRRVQPSELDYQFSRMRSILERKIQDPNHIEWIGLGKTISIWIFVQKTDSNPTDYYRYLMSNDIKNFIQRGYYHYIKKYEENLSLFYLACEDLSIRTQNQEKSFNFSQNNPIYDSTVGDDKKRNILEDYIRGLQITIRISQISIDVQYKNLQPFFKMNLFHIIKLYFS